MNDLISKSLLMKELEKKSVKDSVNNLSTTYTMKELTYIIHTLKTPMLPCPICGKEIDIGKDMYIPERDWKPTFYDPDSGGDPINIHCKCGLEFCTGTYDYQEFVNAWNRRSGKC